MKNYEHISFQRRWHPSPNCTFILGQCAALCESLERFPLFPQDRKNLQMMSFIKGAQATTAIEGNTLNEDEIRKLSEGWTLPKRQGVPGNRSEKCFGCFQSNL